MSQRTSISRLFSIKMKKLVFLVLLIAFFGIATISQGFQLKTVQASTTSPITSPISYFIISGTVKYFYMNSISKPAANVSILATNTQNSSSSASLTNSVGNYSIKVPAGSYIVKASDAKQTVFRPSTILVNVLNANASGINFFGVIKTPTF